MDSAHDRNQWQPRADLEASPSSEDLVQVARMITVGELSSCFAREVLEPVTMIRGHLRFVRESLTPDNTLHMNVEVIDRACRRIEVMANRLIDFSQKRPSQLSSQEPGELVNEAVRFMGSYFQQQFADVKVEVAPGLPQVEVDVTQFTQALVNVLQNAAEAMSNSQVRTLTVEVARKGAILEITISDTGSGIAEANLPRIFTPFFTTKGDLGTGLGLYISRKIIEEHHGEITVQTSSGGTTFTISLPVEP